MNSDGPIPRQHQHQHHQGLDSHSYDSYDSYNAGLWARVCDGGCSYGHFVPAVLLLLTVAYQARSRLLHSPPLGLLLRDAMVWLLPATLLDAVHSWIDPLLLFPRMRTTTSASTHDGCGTQRPSTCKGSADRPPGLGNYDNSCYQNSVLQALASLGPLPAYLASACGGTTDTLRHLLAELNDASADGHTLWTPAVLKNMSTWQQQDAQEYFSKLLDEVDKEVARATRPAGLETAADKEENETAASQHSDDSGYQSLSTHSPSQSHSRAMSEARMVRNPVRNPLEGLTAQRVACVACGYSDGLSMIPFNCLTLNLSDRPEYDILERLDNYTRVEAITGVECAKCTLLKLRGLLLTIIDRSRRAGHDDQEFPEPFARLAAVEAALDDDAFDEDTLLRACKTPSRRRVGSTKTKQAVVARPPRCLALHLNRSVFDETTGHMFKNAAAVRFPVTLDLAPWCLGSAGRESEGEDDGLADEEQWLLDPAASMVAGDEGRSRLVGPIYELRAVITHHGRHENGHYVCYRRHPHGDPAQWWRLSDQDVAPVDEETVLAQGGVFMLYYDCVEPFVELASPRAEVEVEVEPAAPPASHDQNVTDVDDVLETAASTPLPPDELDESDEEACWHAK